MRCLLVSMLLLVGCSASHSTVDASHGDASTVDVATGSDAAITCTTIARPTGSCDPMRGICCTDSVCLDGTCGYPPEECAGDYGACTVRDDCCNARHSCIGGHCQY